MYVGNALCTDYGLAAILTIQLVHAAAALLAHSGFQQQNLDPFLTCLEIKKKRKIKSCHANSTMTGQNEWDSSYLQSSSLLSAWIGESFHPERGEMLTYIKLLVSFFLQNLSWVGQQDRTLCCGPSRCKTQSDIIFIFLTRCCSVCRSMAAAARPCSAGVLLIVGGFSPLTNDEWLL